MELYKKILNILPKKIFNNQEINIEECAINIYLTAKGARPATFPFDVINLHNMYIIREEKLKLKKNVSLALQKLNKMKELKVIIGKYHEGHEEIIIMNRKMYPKYKNILNKMLNPKDKKHHYYVGKLLGYICPGGEFFRWNKQYEFSFVIGKYQYPQIVGSHHLGVTCEMDEKYVLLAIKKLKIYRKYLQEINKSVELIISVL